MSPYRELADVPPDPPPRKDPPGENSGFGLIAFLLLTAIGTAVLSNVLGH